MGIYGAALRELEQYRRDEAAGLLLRLPVPLGATVWRDMKGRFGHKYITPQEAAPYEVRIGGPGVLLFLEGLEDTP